MSWNDIKSIIVTTKRAGLENLTLTTEYKWVLEFGEGMGDTYRIRTATDVFFIPYSEVVNLNIKLKNKDEL